MEQQQDYVLTGTDPDNTKPVGPDGSPTAPNPKQTVQTPEYTLTGTDPDNTKPVTPDGVTTVAPVIVTPRKVVENQPTQNEDVSPLSVLGGFLKNVIPTTYHAGHNLVDTLYQATGSPLYKEFHGGAYDPNVWKPDIGVGNILGGVAQQAANTMLGHNAPQFAQTKTAETAEKMAAAPGGPVDAATAIMPFHLLQSGTNFVLGHNAPQFTTPAEQFYPGFTRQVMSNIKNNPGEGIVNIASAAVPELAVGAKAAKAAEVGEAAATATAATAADAAGTAPKAAEAAGAATTPAASGPVIMTSKGAKNYPTPAEYQQWIASGSKDPADLRAIMKARESQPPPFAPRNEDPVPKPTTSSKPITPMQAGKQGGTTNTAFNAGMKTGQAPTIEEATQTAKTASAASSDASIIPAQEIEDGIGAVKGKHFTAQGNSPTNASPQVSQKIDEYLSTVTKDPAMRTPEALSNVAQSIRAMKKAGMSPGDAQMIDDAAGVIEAAIQKHAPTFHGTKQAVMDAGKVGAEHSSMFEHENPLKSLMKLGGIAGTIAAPASAGHLLEGLVTGAGEAAAFSPRIRGTIGNAIGSGVRNVGDAASVVAPAIPYAQGAALGGSVLGGLASDVGRPAELADRFKENYEKQMPLEDFSKKYPDMYYRP